MWELDYKESWVPKNLCFWNVVLEKTVESPLDCKEIQLVHPEGISPGCSLEGLILKLRLQCFGHLIWRADSFEKTLMLGKIEAGGKGDDRGWDCWMASPTQGTWVWVSSGSWWWIGKPACCHKESDMTEWLNWTEIGRVSGIWYLGLMYSQEGNRQRQSRKEMWRWMKRCGVI